MGIERKVCCVEGCNKLGRLKGRYPSGVAFYDRYCHMHHRIRTTIAREIEIPSLEKRERELSLISGNKMARSNISNKVPCEACGWDKTYVDRHRIDSSIGYYPENVIRLCPNCHRLLHENEKNSKHI